VGSGERSDFMREVRGDFNDLSRRPELGLEGEAVPLGTEDIFPELAMLHDGGEVTGEGVAAHLDANGKRYWYAHNLHNVQSIYVEA
jgi:hypothetical protein